jgi:mycothione reductase
MHFDLVVVGTGSGNTIMGREYQDLDIAIVEAGRFGGTCLNVGCIPTKMYVYPADVADNARRAGPLGVHATIDSIDWPAMRDRIFGRVDEISDSGQEYREGPKWPNITVFPGRGRFTGHKQMAVALKDGGTAEFTADRFVLAAGGRPVIPDIPGLDEDLIGRGAVHTSDTIRRIDDLPERLIVVGGGYIAAEFAHVFDSFGTRVTQLVRGSRLLRHHDADISDTFTTHVQRRYDLRRDTDVCGVKPATTTGDGVSVVVEGPYGESTIEADLLLLATGRRPNSDLLNLSATGVTTDARHLVIVDEYQETVVPGIFALGDISSPNALKHVANHEARIVRHNLMHPDDRWTTDHRFVPAAVFTEPQVASVGLTEKKAKEAGYEVNVGRFPFIGNGKAIALGEPDGLCKTVFDKKTGQLLGAHLVGPEVTELIQGFVIAMNLETTEQELIDAVFPHPTLSETMHESVLAAYGRVIHV